MRLTYVRGIDSIRAVGVVLVVIYHLFTNILPGGFFGVDIFFVISGFLVTSLFVRERGKTGHIDLIGFLTRRVRRLLPAAGFMVVVTLSLSLLVSPDLRAKAPMRTAAVFGWMTNYFEIQQGGSYEGQFLPNLFLHTWTLGVEMQYYVIWGALFAFVVFLYNRIAMRAGRAAFSQRRTLLICCAAIAAASYILMRVRLEGLPDPSPVYYATSTRIYPLIIGSALGLATGMRVPRKRLPAPLALPAFFAILVVVVWMGRTFSFSGQATYHYGILVASGLTVAALYCLLSLQPMKFFRDPAPLAYLGKRSYSIYLFHWPLYHIFKQIGTYGLGPFPEQTPHIVYALISIAVTFVFAEISYRVFEQPPIAAKSREGGSATSSRLWRGVMIGFCACIVPSVIALMTAPMMPSTDESNLHTQVVQNITQMAQYESYFSGLALDPVALHAKPDQLPPSPSEIEAALDTDADAQQTWDNAQQAMNQEDPAGPVQPIAPPGGANVTVFGDSVTLGAADVIQETLGSVIVDAKVSRNMGVASDMINEYEARGELGEYVVLALFTNYQNFTVDATYYALSMIPPGHRVILVTPFGKDYMEAGADFVRALPGQFDYVTVADWNAAIRDHRNLLAPDGLHMNGNDSKQIYANLIAQAIEQASKKPAKQ